MNAALPIIGEIEAHFDIKLNVLETLSTASFADQSFWNDEENYCLVDDNKVIGLKLKGKTIDEFPFVDNSALQSLKALKLDDTTIKSLYLSKCLQNLENLDLSDNLQLSNLIFEGGFPHLSTFHGSHFSAESIELPDCPSLKVLDLHNNQIKSLSFTGTCPSLTNLSLEGNRALTQFAIPTGFKNLTRISFKNCSLRQLSFGYIPPELKQLDLSGNKLQDWPRNFLIPDSLEELYLYGNDFRNVRPEFVIQISGGNSCQSMRLREIIREIENYYGIELKSSQKDSLQSFAYYQHRGGETCSYLVNENHKIIGLNLRASGISEFPFVDEPRLKLLRALRLSENAISSLQITENLNGLEYLDISDNLKLTSFDLPLEMPVLREIVGSYCSLKKFNLPDFPLLTKIDFKNNNLESFSFRNSCRSLTDLDLSENRSLTKLKLPPEVENLTTLSLKNCNLTQFPFVDFPSRLQHLDLNGNNLSHWPENLLISDGLKRLYLYGNPLQNIPEKFVSKDFFENSCQPIRAWQKSFIDNINPIYLDEARLILVGNAMVGKSSIRIRLLDEIAPLPSIEDRTAGLFISEEAYHLKNLPEALTKVSRKVDFKLNIWDFGGQSIYREAQQIFLSPNTLYLFVTSCNDIPEQTESYVNFTYWIKLIKAFSLDQKSQKISPIIYVLNKVDLEKNHDILPNVPVKDFAQIVKISCKTGDYFPILKEVILHTIPLINNQIFNIPFSQTWLDVKETLQKLNRKYLSIEDYLNNICAPILDEDQARTLLSYLDQIGSVIHLKSEEESEEWIILDTSWLTTSIFKVLDSGLNDVIPKKVFSKTIWPDHSEEERKMLLELMSTRYLCFKDGTQAEADLEYIFPALLKDEIPILDDYDLKGKRRVQLRLKYSKVLFPGTINKLMARLKKGTIKRWKNNLLVLKEDTFGHIEEVWEENILYLSMYGENYPSLYAKIQNALDEVSETQLSSYDNTYVLEGKFRQSWLGREKILRVGQEKFAFLRTMDSLIQESEEEPEVIDRQFISRKGLAKKLQKTLESENKGLKEKARHLIKNYEELEENLINDEVSIPEFDTKKGKILQEANKIVIAYEQFRLEQQLKKKALFLCSSPNGKNPLDFGGAFRQIEEARQVSDHRDNFAEIEIKTGVKRRELLQLLTKYQPDILHISLHSSKTKGLYFENKIGDEDPINAESFAKMIQTYCKNPKGKKKIEVIILDACNTKEHGEAVVPYSDYVICTQDFYPNEAGIRYAEEFYHLIFELNDIQYAHDVAVTAIEIEGYERPEDVKLPIHEIPIILKNQ